LAYSPEKKILKERRKPPFDLLSGFGARKQFFGKNMISCEKEIRFRINLKNPKKGSISIHLISPFDFSQRNWYGKFRQEADVYVNDSYLKEQKLKFGRNVVKIPLASRYMKGKENIIRLKFKYSKPFGFDHFWYTACFLNKIEVSTPFFNK